MKNQFKGFYVLSAVLLLIAILLPILVNQCFINLFMKSAPLGNKEWLGFFGSYLGGIIGFNLSCNTHRPTHPRQAVNPAPRELADS